MFEKISRSLYPCLALLITLGPMAIAADKTDIIYVESNRADHNSILVYKNVSGTPVLVNEFPTDGKGVFDLSLRLGPFDSDQDVITNAEGTVLYAVNGGSDSIAAFHIDREGQLTALQGSPFSSGGTDPVSVGIARDTAVVVNKAMGTPGGQSTLPSYASFSLDTEGRFDGLLSTYLAPAGSSPSQADISAGKRLVFDAQFLGGNLQSFLLQPDGSLTPEDHVAPPDGAKPLGLWSHPNAPILYVGFVTKDRLGVYTFDPSGKLNFVRSVKNSGKAICWLRTNAAGTRLYTANTTDNSVSVYDTTVPLNPVEIQHLPLKGLGNALQFMLGPREDYLYLVTQRASAKIPLGKGNTLHILKVDKVTGTLSETDDSFVQLPVPPGTRPQGVAAIQLR
jgi:hypothetical protein